MKLKRMQLMIARFICNNRLASDLGDHIANSIWADCLEIIKRVIIIIFTSVEL